MDERYNHKMLLVWYAALALVMAFLVFRLAIPWLVNQQNTAAFPVAFLLGGLTITGLFFVARDIWAFLNEKGDEDE